MYPLLYTQQPSYPNTPYGMVPVLTYARDVPGLALGYQLPAIRHGDRGRQVGSSGRRRRPSGRDAVERRTGALRLLDTRGRAAARGFRGPLLFSATRALDALRAAAPPTRSRRLARAARRRSLAVAAPPAHLANSFAVPGTDSARADAALATRLRRAARRERSRSSSASPPPPTAAPARAPRPARARGARRCPAGGSTTFRAGGGAVYGELVTSLSLQQAKALHQPLRDALRRAAGPTALVTGTARDPARPRPAARRRPPPRRGARAAARAARARLRARALARARDPVRLRGLHDRRHARRSLRRGAASSRSRPYATNVVELIGLGLAVDYSLLVVCRYREELERGSPRDAAIVRTMADGRPGRRLLRRSPSRSGSRSCSSCPFRSSGRSGWPGC